MDNSIVLINDSSDSNHSSTFTVFIVAAFTKKEERKRQRQQAKKTPIRLQSTVGFVCELYLFYALSICRFMESRNQQHHSYG